VVGDGLYITGTHASEAVNVERDDGEEKVKETQQHEYLVLLRK
jgi:hypothetical protein